MRVAALCDSTCWSDTLASELSRAAADAGIVPSHGRRLSESERRRLLREMLPATESVVVYADSVGPARMARVMRRVLQDDPSSSQEDQRVALDSATVTTG